MRARPTCGMGGLRIAPTMNKHRPAPLFLLFFLCLSLPACGGGGAPPAAAPAALAITTLNLPGGTVGTPIDCPPLQANNVEGLATWDLTSGALPSGLVLDAEGEITGTPSQNGQFDFVVRVRDDVAADTQPLSITIGSIDLAVTGGLTLGDAWVGRPLTLTASGSVGSVSFSIVANDSGGALSQAAPLAGTITYTPGPTGGADSTDTIDATDDSTGITVEIDIDVMPNPAAGHTASFGSSDVWWVDPNQKFGSHAYSTDLHKALADIGLRAPASTGAVGTEADELALLWLRIELLRQVNIMFLRNSDGSAGASGLAITFPFDEPGAGYAKPSAANVIFGAPTNYSQMGITHGSSSGVIGTAFLDGASNGFHENDTSDSSSELGVFANQITPIFNNAYNNPLASNPVGAGDANSLRALLFGLPSSGGRYDQIRYVGQGFARTMAAVLAHEAGHSLGLPHTSPSQANSIMNPAALISPSATYTFTTADVASLRTALPGAGKTTAPLAAQKAGSAMPEGGVVVCHCRACRSDG